ncbi:DNA-3-methyladenine glycosylase 2 [Virgibacillus sp. YIM 98842]|jgi:DNA-3-methyladenine glycosylase II|uniref:DNA-3-methyladenine glycosylase family protein n=1 Tax=Virgibacillus sp. YIM 98842 TaxID=2663533 RepID=UPI0013DBF091|nr:DNA-3-methyladenine glycosylase 2 [Virgibacillus sp. YIM 98842]
MDWQDHKNYITVKARQPFQFSSCLNWLKKRDKEIIYELVNEHVLILIPTNEGAVLGRIEEGSEGVKVSFPESIPSLRGKNQAAQFVNDWFDMDTDILPFYQLAEKDPLLRPLVHKHYGMRIVGIPDLFEALSWAVIGQQINLTFAYKVKRRFIDTYGAHITYKGTKYWLFPRAEKIADLDPEALRELQFSIRKAEYIIDMAKMIRDGALSKEKLQHLDPLSLKKELMAIRGIGHWSAEYVRMKCFRHPDAFPVADVGLHNALKSQLGWDRKPEIEEIEEMAAHLSGWEAYAVFYLWMSNG